MRLRAGVASFYIHHSEDARDKVRTVWDDPVSVAAALTVSQLSADSQANNQPVGRQLGYSSLSGCGCGCSACIAGSRQL
jgi:hypothetical protein